MINVREIVDVQYNAPTRKIMSWLWTSTKGVRGKAVANVILGIVSVCLDFCFILTTKWIIDIATGCNTSSLTLSVLILMAILLTQIAISFSDTWVNAILGLKNVNQMQLRTFSKILNCVWTGSEKHHSGDTMNRLITDTNSVVSLVNDTIPSIITVIFRMIGAFVIVYSMSPVIAVVLICVFPAFLLVSKLYIGKMRGLNRDVRDIESRVHSILQESIQNRVIIKVLEQSAEIISKLTGTQTELRDRVIRKTKFSSVSNLIMSIGFTAGYFITFVWGARNLQAGEISYGMMLAFVQLVGQIQGPFKSLAAYIPAIVGAFTSAERLMELEEVPAEEEGTPVRFEGSVGVRLDNVSFIYADGDKKVISDLSYDFKPGSVTAIVGETGRGKTTLVRLILALLKPTGGKVEFYSGETGQSVEVSPLTRCNIVYVPQGNTLLSGTIRENLLLGDPNATDEKLMEAIRLSCADFVFRKEEGLDFHCGEDGGGLSEGQAQRISIARGLLRTGNVVILDESTSALDAQTEDKFITNLESYAETKQKTVIFITHKTTVINRCRNVMNMDN